MKNIFLSIASALVCGAIMSGCGGGGASGGARVKQNEYLGKIPAIYAAYVAEKEAADEHVAKLVNDGKEDEARKFMTELEAKEEELDAKFKADLNAEINAVIGREVPVTMSEGLKNSGEYTVEPTAKLTTSQYPDRLYNSPGAVVKLSVADGGVRSEYAHYRYVATDGSTIGEPAALRLEEGEHTITSGPVTFSYLEEWADFAGIEFWTEEERAADRERRRANGDN